MTAYAVIAAGGLQLADIVAHALDFPGWVLRALIWLAALGLPVTFAISWFWDLTRHGFIRTVAPGERPAAPRAGSPEGTLGRTPLDPARFAEAAAALQIAGPGAVLAGRYQVERELGKGGMGRVLAARDLRLGRRVAIKVVTGARDPSRLRRFEQEARTAGALEHPNILAVYDLGEQDGIPFLVTELLEGQTLRRVIDRGALPPQEVQRIALQLSFGLAAAHATGVVHRDLKPENLFLTRDGRLKILDFGMAKLLSPDAAGPGLTVTGALFGSPGYLSPEQARGEPAGPPSDVFSAGAILYELLTGRRAFPGSTLVEAGHAAITAEPTPLPPSVPPSLAAAILRALKKEPRARFADGGELARTLEAAPDLPPGTRPPRRGTPRRLSAPVSAGVAVLAVGVAIASALWVHTGGARSDGTSPPSVRSPAPRVPTPPLPPGVPGFDAEKFAEQMSHVPEVGGTTPGLMAGVRALEAIGRGERAEKMLEGYLKSRPGDLGAQMELAALRRRDGHRERADADLKKIAQALQGDDWMKPLVRAWVGLIPEEQALEAARVPGDEDATSARLTQAYYYLGLKHETAQPPDLRTARRDFERAVDRKGDVPEQALAAEALQRLTPDDSEDDSEE